jgi:hypothetical protein
MTLALEWADAQDGSGGTLTVSGSAGGTIVVYACRIDALSLAALAWTSVGTRVGDGTLTLALTYPAYYWLYATEDGTVDLAAPIRAPVTTSASSVTERFKDALAARFSELVMTPANVGGTVPNDKVYKRILPAPDLTIEYPCIILSNEGVAESLVGGTNARDDVGYPVVVWMLDRNNSSYSERDGLYTLWRQQLIRAVRNWRAVGVSEIMTVQVEPQPIYDPKLPAYELVVSGFVARGLARELRGLT